MKFLFLIGIEGSGHHMFHSILEPHEEKDYFVMAGKWRQALVERWDATPILGRRNKVYKLLNLYKPKPPVVFANELSTIFSQYKQAGATHLFESISFPFNHPRDTLRRPDIIEFVEVLKGRTEYKLIVLYRNPISATYSGIRRGFTDNVRLQAKIVEDNLIYIASQMSTIDQELYKVIDFDEFLANPTAYVKPLAAWWGLEEELLAKGLKNIYQPTQIKEIPTETKRILEAFFTESRISQWNTFYSSNKLEI